MLNQYDINSNTRNDSIEPINDKPVIYPPLSPDEWREAEGTDTKTREAVAALLRNLGHISCFAFAALVSK